MDDARSLLVLSEGLVTVAKKTYKASSVASELKEDRERAYQTAQRVAEISLLAEAKLGELLQKEFNHEGGRPEENGNSNFTVLKNLGLGKMDSSRLQKVAQHKDLISEAVESAKV